MWKETATLVCVALLAGCAGGGARQGRDEIPLPEGLGSSSIAPGRVVEAGSRADDVDIDWYATVEVDDASDQEDALAAALGAGFALDASLEGDGVRSFTLRRGETGMSLVLRTEDRVPVVEYVVVTTAR